MPDDKVKTIEIDEVLPADGGEGMKSSHRASGSGTGPETSHGPTGAEDMPFPDLRSNLGWKARITLTLTQWFLYLRSKSWGKWVIGPLVILGVLLITALAILFAIPLILVAILRSLTRR